MITKDFEGAVVERVYYAVTVAPWLPVIGESFDTIEEAATYADRKIAESGVPDATVTTRAVFRLVRGVKEDMPVDINVRYHGQWRQR